MRTRQQVVAPRVAARSTGKASRMASRMTPLPPNHQYSTLRRHSYSDAAVAAVVADAEHDVHDVGKTLAAGRGGEGRMQDACHSGTQHGNSIITKS